MACEHAPLITGQSSEYRVIEGCGAWPLRLSAVHASLVMANIEHRALLQCAHGLTDLLQHNLSVSDKLLEKGWVTKDVHGWALTARGVSDHEKASRLVSCLTDRVKDAAQVFHDFLAVLKEDPFFADIVEKINAEYRSMFMYQL